MDFIFKHFNKIFIGVIVIIVIMFIVNVIYFCVTGSPPPWAKHYIVIEQKLDNK